MVAAAELSFADLIEDQPDTYQVHTDAYMAASVFDTEIYVFLNRCRHRGPVACDLSLDRSPSGTISVLPGLNGAPR